jgi:hypothetical protein
VPTTATSVVVGVGGWGVRSMTLSR